MTGPSDRALAAAAEALGRVGAIGDDVIVREGASLLVRRGTVLARVRPVAEAAVSERELSVAARLGNDGVPVVEAIGASTPVVLDGFVATCWRWVPAVGPAGPDDVGRLVRTLRTATSGGGRRALAVFDPIAHIVGVVGDCGDEPDVCFVRERADRLRAAFEAAAADDPLGEAVVHGDLHAGNVAVGDAGAVVLDLELSGWGPPSYDLVPAVVAERRYGASVADLVAFLTAAGADSRSWPGFDAFVDVYELWVTAWAVSVAHRRRDWAEEAARRVASLRDGSDDRWHLS